MSRPESGRLRRPAQRADEPSLRPGCRDRGVQRLGRNPVGHV